MLVSPCIVTLSMTQWKFILDLTENHRKSPILSVKFGGEMRKNLISIGLYPANHLFELLHMDFHGISHLATLCFRLLQNTLEKNSCSKSFRGHIYHTYIYVW